MPYSLLIIVVIIFFLFRKSKKKRNSKNSAVYTNSKRVPSNSYCEVYVYGDELFSTLTYKNSKGFAKSELVVVDVKDKQYPGRVVELYSERPDNLDPSIRCREVVRKLSIEDKGKVAFWSRKIENFLNPKSEKEEYLTCVTGLAFYFAAKFFNVSSKIDKILISGFTQRTSKVSGNVEDVYVYSVIFDRESFSKLKIKEAIPYRAFEFFKHVISYTSNFDLLNIEPLSSIK